MRVAVVHDWLYTLGGAERVLKEVLALYPQADVFCLFDTLRPDQRLEIGYRQSTTSFLQRVPRIGRLHRSLLPLMPLAIEQLDLTGYDLVISSSYAVAKGVITGPHQAHVSYVHSPMRYAWDLQGEYLGTPRGLGKLKSGLARLMLHRIRVWDTASAPRPTVLVANSNFVRLRIRKTWGRDAHVVHPPVDCDAVAAGAAKGSHFFAAGRLVGYKNVRAIVEAFKLLPEQRLRIAGTGPEEKALRALAGPNVTFLGYLSDAEMRLQMASAQAFIFAGVEDFGIMPLEAQAEGTPVIALGRGGALETVVGHGAARTGLFFEEPNAAAIAAAVNVFLVRSREFTAQACMAQARRFSAQRFRAELQAIISAELARIDRERTPPEFIPEVPAQVLALRVVPAERPADDSAA